MESNERAKFAIADRVLINATDEASKKTNVCGGSRFSHLMLPASVAHSIEKISEAPDSDNKVEVCTRLSTSSSSTSNCLLNASTSSTSSDSDSGAGTRAVLAAGRLGFSIERILREPDFRPNFPNQIKVMLPC